MNTQEIEVETPGVFYAVVSCGPSSPHRYEAPATGPAHAYARFATEAEAWQFIKKCGGSAWQNTAHWEAAYHASTPPTCDTPYCHICRSTTPVTEQAYV
jgi:hypothetical protein